MTVERVTGERAGHLATPPMLNGAIDRIAAGPSTVIAAVASLNPRQKSATICQSCRMTALRMGQETGRWGF